MSWLVPIQRHDMAANSISRLNQRTSGNQRISGECGTTQQQTIGMALAVAMRPREARSIGGEAESLPARAAAFRRVLNRSATGDPSV
jgi:hypothetical protein